MSDSAKSRDAIGVLPMPISLLPFEKIHRSPKMCARFSKHLSFNHVEDPRQSSRLIAIQLVSAFLLSKRVRLLTKTSRKLASTSQSWKATLPMELSY